MAKRELMEVEKRLAELREKDPHGRREYLDPTPMAPPIGYKKQPSMIDIVREQVRVALSQEALRQGMETFDEADDFEVGDDFEPASEHELDEDLPSIAELKRRHDEATKALAAAVNPSLSNSNPPAAAQPGAGGSPDTPPAVPAGSPSPSTGTVLP